MKRSLNSSSSCPSPSSSASSSTCIGSDSPIQPERPKPKRAKKNKSSGKCQNQCSPNSTKRSSIYRGVTRHRWTGRFEAHLWDKSSWNSIQNKKGKQVYLGAYDIEEAAARTYDLAALKYWGPETILNFPLESYAKELEEMQKVSKEEYLASLRRQSSGFSRGVSKYRGVARHHHNGRWEARIGRVFGNKYLYLGTYNTQEEAAAAYDMAAIEYRGANAVTNFDVSNYIDRLKKKGVFTFPLNRTQESVLLESSIKAEETRDSKSQEFQQELEEERKQHNEKPEEEEETEEFQYTEKLPQCMDVSDIIMAMEPQHNNNNELTWSFCMDDSGLKPLLRDEDFRIEKHMELPALLDEIEFEDNIDFMFDEVKPDCSILDNTSCCGEDEVVVVVDGGGGGKEPVPSSSSSSSSDSHSSTTTSVSCSYSV